MKKKWWIVPALVAYLLIGIWVGSTGYKVHENWQEYDESVRFFFYPVSAILIDGWCEPNQTCIFPGTGKKPEYYITLVSFLKRSQAHNPRASYIFLLSLTWPLKIVWLILCFVLIMVIALTLIVLVFLMFLGGAVSVTAMWLMSFLL